MNHCELVACLPPKSLKKVLHSDVPSYGYCIREWCHLPICVRDTWDKHFGNLSEGQLSKRNMFPCSIVFFENCIMLVTITGESILLYLDDLTLDYYHEDLDPAEARELYNFYKEQEEKAHLYDRNDILAGYQLMRDVIDMLAKPEIYGGKTFEQCLTRRYGMNARYRYRSDFNERGLFIEEKPRDDGGEPSEGEWVETTLFDFLTSFIIR